ncbi:MAG: prephenate dehydrogenase/arogenate dehydrogenase family protein [Betaproteobacteria bacterium]
MKPIGKLVVIGVGLIGGSLALALRSRNAVVEVVGVGRSQSNLDEALRLGIIDRAESDYAPALADADVVLVATPVAQMPAVLARIFGHLAPRTIVTDGGSTKQDVIAAARSALGAKFDQFVPGHPIAGTEHTGAGAAFPELYRNRKVVLTPEVETRAEATAIIRSMWEATGASVIDMPAERHDAILAAVSHLPHLLAFALVEELALRPDAPDYFRFAAGGFRDFTRIASSSPEMWRDIALANQQRLLDELRRYRGQVERLESLVAAGDADGLFQLFTTARDARNDWLARQT